MQAICVEPTTSRVLREKAATVMSSACVRCISDVHVDEALNMKWIEGLMSRSSDALIVAGDISDRLELVQKTLRVLKTKYAEVFCVPGNHDLWVDRRAQKDSLQKLHAFDAICAEEGVHTKPMKFAADSTHAGVWIVPMLSWHHQSFDTEPDITCWNGIPKAEDAMRDYHMCLWPPPLRAEDETVASAIDTLNNYRIDSPDLGTDSVPIISFSHFVPRIELMPEKRFLYLPTLNKAVGSTFLGDRIQKLRPDAHVFGHTHFGWDATIDGIRYVQAALGYPTEWRQRPASMEIGELPEEPLLLWRSEEGFVPHMSCRWSGFYERNARQPALTNMLAPYVAPMYEPLSGAEVCDWPFGPPG